MNTCTKFLITGLICVAPITSFSGCAGQMAKDGDGRFAALEKQIVQLKAENANLKARTRELDDKVLLYEKKQALARRQIAEEGLRTVRLTPEYGEESPEPEATESSVSFRDDLEVDEKNRPKLTLNESSLARYGNSVPATNGSAEATRQRASMPQPWSDIPVTNRGDNLGVMGADGQMQQAEEDSMALFNAAYRSYNNKDYPGALAGFSAFLQKESNHKFADNAMFWIAECYLAQGQLFKAVGEFERLLRRYPRSEQAASSLYRIGFIYDRLQDAAKAREYYFKVVEKFPGTEAARKASKRMVENKGSATLVRTSAKR
ncbi:MAG: tetratricopeptide repeat protein [Deltaproteobacteria bacterium]|nr:tetratricopeptide repeat protein [Deltaproteobacteria bacterium]